MQLRRLTNLGSLTRSSLVSLGSFQATIPRWYNFRTSVGKVMASSLECVRLGGNGPDTTRIMVLTGLDTDTSLEMVDTYKNGISPNGLPLWQEIQDGEE